MTDQDPAALRARQRVRILLWWQIASALLVVAGLVIAHSNLLMPGGWPLLGYIIAGLGLIEMWLMPRALRRTWRQDDAAR